MEPQNVNPQNNDSSNKDYEGYEAYEKRGKRVAGLILIVIGSVLLAKAFGVMFPHWLVSWKVLLILIGLGIGIKSKFSNIGWLFPFAVGVFFLSAELIPDLHIRQYFWPIFIILLGVFFIFRPKKSYRHHYSRYQKRYGRSYGNDVNNNSNTSFFADGTTTNDMDNYLDATTFMGGIKKIVLSKNFKGGEISAVFGGAEINLTQADFEKEIKLEVNAVFGGVKLIIPANWEIKSNATAVLGGIDDKRPIQNNPLSGPTKRILLEGNCVLGGIEIRSY
jgi:predicted membrane protein